MPRITLIVDNVLGKRAGQATEPVTANRSARNTTLSILIGRDRLGCLTGSLSKYVNVERIHSHIGLGLGLSNITSRTPTQYIGVNWDRLNDQPVEHEPAE